MTTESDANTRPERRGETFVHIPTPGDHYSPRTGSAVMTVIYELAKCHAAAGGRSQVIVGNDTWKPNYDVGERVDVRYPAPLSRRQKAQDVLLGRAGLPRCNVERLYRPAFEAIPADFTGPVFVHNAPGAIRLLKRLRPRVCACLYCHNTLFDTYTAREVRKVAAAADRIICVSEFLAKYVRSCARVDPGNIRVVLNGVDTEEFRPADRRHHGDPPVVLFVGRVIPQKGVHLLIQAALKLHHAGHAFRLRIVGSSGFNARDPLSPYEQELRRLAAPLGDTVEFLPFADRARIVCDYQSADAFGVPSDCDEGYGLTVLEAMACGLPVIASRRGGIPEAGGDAVLYFDPPDVDALAERLAFLLDDEKVRAEWGARARRRAEQMTWAMRYCELLAALE